jgi:hypothetical protein
MRVKDVPEGKVYEFKPRSEWKQGFIPPEWLTPKFLEQTVVVVGPAFNKTQTQTQAASVKIVTVRFASTTQKPSFFLSF